MEGAASWGLRLGMVRSKPIGGTVLVPGEASTACPRCSGATHAGLRATYRRAGELVTERIEDRWCPACTSTIATIAALERVHDLEARLERAAVRIAQLTSSTSATAGAPAVANKASPVANSQKPRGGDRMATRIARSRERLRAPVANSVANTGDSP